MKRPEMIIFDYGHTLLYEPEHNRQNANIQISKYISKNPNNISFEEFDKNMTEIFRALREKCGDDIETPVHNILKAAYAYMGIELSVPMEEAERIIWEGISLGAVMPHADEMIDYLNSIGIRTAVISNLGFSGKALKERLNRLLPNNQFEFVLVSSEYIFRKPHPFMFQIAMQKAGLPADKIWFCGDSIKRDIYGAQGVGMFPVLYEGKTEEDVPKFMHQNDGYEIDFEYLHIHDWREMKWRIDTLFDCDSCAKWTKYE